MVTAKVILCVWTGIFMVLPGCLCQVLEPLGIHVPHHHHHGEAGLARRGHDPCEVKPVQAPEPLVPCHCDERPDRTSDECVAVASGPQELPDEGWCHASVTVAPVPTQVTRVCSRTSRGPPARCSAMMRSFLCVYLV